MKKYTLILTVAAAALFIGTSASASTPTPTPPAWECKLSGWNPELYSFYGKNDIIVEKLAHVPVNLSKRRVFLQITQGDSSGEVKLYERQKDGTFTVTEWTVSQTSGLLADIDKAIIANKGVNCVGEEVKKILKRLKDEKVSQPLSADASPQTAFGASVTKASGDFIKTAIVILC